MDAKDRILLAELSLNARIPLKSLSKKLLLSESSSLYRLERLKKQGIILNTHVILNPFKLGKIGFRVYFSLRKVYDTRESEIIQWLKLCDEVLILGKELNSSKYVLMSWTENTTIFSDFIEQFKFKFGKFVSNLDPQVYVAGRYYARKYLTGKDRNVLEAKISKKESFDNTDIDILKLLSLDARKSSLSIAKEINKDTQTVISRIKILEKKEIILGYGINIDISKIGFQYYKLNLIFSEKIPRSTLLEFAKNCDYTVYVDETIGFYDFEINLEVDSKERLQSIIKDLEVLGCGFEFLEIKEIERYEKLVFI